MKLEIAHLFEHPAQLPEVARRIHEEWWTEVPGASAASMAARLREASNPDAIPLCLIALREGRQIGVVNLVENDNEERPDLRPWLAALLVSREVRGEGVGKALYRALVAEAARLGVDRLYLGTDIPQYYLRLGARVYQEYEGGYHIMVVDTGYDPDG